MHLQASKRFNMHLQKTMKHAPIQKHKTYTKNKACNFELKASTKPEACTHLKARSKQKNEA
jgi:hypothetical protein